VREATKTLLAVALFTCFATGCVRKEVFQGPAPTAVTACSKTCRCAALPAEKMKVFLVSGQGSVAGQGGSQFTDYVAYGKYAGRADFVIEPLNTSGFTTPTLERAREIADDIAAAIGPEGRDVEVWAFSLGASLMAQVSPVVEKKLGSVRHMHVLLIDPLYIDDRFGGRAFLNLMVALGDNGARILRDAAPYIRSSPHYLNLSDGAVINIDFNPHPVYFFTRLFNADRHYAWPGKTELQRKILAYVDTQFEAALACCCY
jgi:hypothetical protein